MPGDATASWGASPSQNVTEYDVQWSQNGTKLPLVKVPRTSAQDATGYTSDFETATGVTPAPGDDIGCTIDAVDGPHSLSSAFVPTVPPDVVPVPLAAPSPPTNPTLAIT